MVKEIPLKYLEHFQDSGLRNVRVIGQCELKIGGPGISGENMFPELIAYKSAVFGPVDFELE